jgi:hypothetical protein
VIQAAGRAYVQKREAKNCLRSQWVLIVQNRARMVVLRRRQLARKKVAVLLAARVRGVGAREL